jgi:extracellular factor (EF) 3-hydroxypalmitic acid methyl ester biosynthesis protein
MELQVMHNVIADVINSSPVSREKKSQIELLKAVKDQLQGLLQKGGPDENEYQMLDRVMLTLYQNLNNGLVLQEEIDALKGLFTNEFLDETMHGYGYRKPMGYAGDFLLIDRIYTFHKSTHPQFVKWDNYFHFNEATSAVRNRKEYFKQRMLEKIASQDGSIKLLDVASGPARDLHELFQQIDKDQLTATCVDLDARAINHARELCKEEADNIEFVNKNILRFSTTERFDVIWSAGLFDYFDNKIFVLALKKFLSWLKPGGEIIIGNFSEDNSSRGYMELFGEWILIHRSPEQLIQLAKEAGAQDHQIVVDSEPLGINLFLRIKSA